MFVGAVVREAKQPTDNKDREEMKGGVLPIKTGKK